MYAFYFQAVIKNSILSIQHSATVMIGLVLLDCLLILRQQLEQSDKGHQQIVEDTEI